MYTIFYPNAYKTVINVDRGNPSSKVAQMRAAPRNARVRHDDYWRFFLTPLQTTSVTRNFKTRNHF